MMATLSFTELAVGFVHGVDVELLEWYFVELVVDVDQVVYVETSFTAVDVVKQEVEVVDI
jgi:hypothetical protein